jgi:hypothetical protein
MAFTYFVRKLGFEPSFHLTTGTFNLFVKDLKLGCRLSGPGFRCPGFNSEAPRNLPSLQSRKTRRDEPYKLTANCCFLSTHKRRYSLDSRPVGRFKQQLHRLQPLACPQQTRSNQRRAFLNLVKDLAEVFLEPFRKRCSRMCPVGPALGRFWWLYLSMIKRPIRFTFGGSICAAFGWLQLPSLPRPHFAYLLYQALGQRARAVAHFSHEK